MARNVPLDKIKDDIVRTSLEVLQDAVREIEQEIQALKDRLDEAGH